jgi:phenylpropionate dioxygenase-like ring-hydroxylating dioxygenase large terminal subunit
VHAVENRCAHRQLKLTLGEVCGDALVCGYHGWAYSGAGECVRIPHEIPTAVAPRIRIRAYAVEEKYGIVWVFPGDPDAARRIPLPACAPLDGPRGWRYVPLTFTWRAHHSMIVENVCDFYHEYLHRRLRPFRGSTIRRLEEDGDRVSVEYETFFGGSALARLAGYRELSRPRSIRIEYEYPYQRSDIDGRYLHWMFPLPMDEGTTRVFFLFAFGAIQVPGLGVEVPRWLRSVVLRLINALYVTPLLRQDGAILEAEMDAYRAHGDRPAAELNPVVRMLQAVIARKWEESPAP